MYTPGGICGQLNHAAVEFADVVAADVVDAATLELVTAETLELVAAALELAAVDV